MLCELRFIACTPVHRGWDSLQAEKVCEKFWYLETRHCSAYRRKLMLMTWCLAHDTKNLHGISALLLCRSTLWRT